MDHIKVIKTAEDHEKALARLIFLMDEEPSPGSREADELDVLALLIERYEEENFPIDIPDPIEAIKFRMEQQDLKRSDLIPYIGSASKLSEVLSGKRKLSLNMIRKLSVGLNIPADVLIYEPTQKLASNNEIDWQAFPLSEMRKRGYFEGFMGSLQELREYAAEWVSKLLSSVPNGFSLQPALLRTTAHLRSNDKETDPYALWAWQVRVLQKAQEEQLPENYISGTVDHIWMKKLAQLSWSERGPQLAIEYLNLNGIHVIVEPHLSKTYLDGASCLDSNGNPIIALTLRHDRLDNFWFTLMHELAHISLHIDGTEMWFIDDLEVDGEDDVELQADALAQKSLIPENVWSKLKSPDPESIKYLAKTLSINPCIIAGRLRHERKNHKMFGTLFRDKIKPFVTA